MNKVTKIFLNILLLGVVLTVAAACAWWTVTVRHWPWWAGVSLASGIVFLFFFALFLKKFLVRRRQKKFIDHVVEQKAVISEQRTPDQIPLEKLESKWKKSLSLLRDSHLRARGNPLYVLPWYLALGNTGSGKTTALYNSGLGPSFTEVEDRNGVIPTRNCDWFYFTNAIILDSAGRYAFPADPDQDQKEWKRLLELLLKHRKKNVLDGILLFISAEQIDRQNKAELEKAGQVLRNRLDNIMRASGYRLPVFVVISQMDKIPGFSDFAENMPEELIGQPMGFFNADDSAYWHEILHDAIDTISQRINQLSLIQVATDNVANPASLLFPGYFDTFKQKITSILHPLLGENEFQAKPLFAGLYLGSGKNTANPVPVLLTDSLSLQPEHLAKSGGRAVFLHDFLSSVVGTARKSIEPISEYARWRRLTSNLGLICWILFCVSLAGLAGVSYLHNLEVLNTLQQASVTSPIPSENESDQLVNLENLRLTIQQIDQKNRSWRLPYIGFTHSTRAAAELKKRYCSLFVQKILSPMENSLEGEIAKVDHFDDTETYPVFLVYTVDQINLLQNYLAGKKIDILPTFDTVTAKMLTRDNTGLAYEVAQYFDDLYYSYLQWSDDLISSKNRLDKLHKILDDLLKRKEGNVSWLFNPLLAQSKPLHLSRFWQYPDTKDLEEIMIPGAFTREGRRNIQQFITLLQQSGIQNDYAKTVQQGFDDTYPQRFYFWWNSFAESFPKGEELLTSESDWRETSVRMTTGENPYFSFLETMAAELNFFARDSGKDLPQWAAAVVAFDTVRSVAADKKATADKKSSILSRAKLQEKEIVEKTLQGVDADKAAAVALQLQLASAWNDYEAALTGLSPVATYKEKAYQLYVDWFNDTLAANKDNPSLFGKTYEATLAMQGLAKGVYENPLAWSLVHGPFTFISQYSAQQSARVIQQAWTEQVVAQTYNVDKNKLPSLLFDKDTGFVWKFVQDTAGTFLMRSPQGYLSREVFGNKINFLSSFYTFLNEAQAGVLNQQPSYTVTLRTLPIEVNDEATVEPFSTVVTLQCAKEQQVLENDNFKRSLTFKWDPDQCSDVTLAINFPDITLTRSYPGFMGFAHFLDDFKSGTLVLSPGDFPGQKMALENIRVSSINLSYSITGADSVLKLLNRIPLDIPEEIIRPQDQGLTAKTQTQKPALSAETNRFHTQNATNGPAYYDGDGRIVRPLSIETVHYQPFAADAGKTGNMNIGAVVRQEGWLLAQNGEQYIIQLMSLQNDKNIETVFANLPPSETAAYYCAGIRKKTWYRLFWGIFPTRADAEAAIAKLPAQIRDASPMVRKLIAVQEEILSQPDDPTYACTYKSSS